MLANHTQRSLETAAVKTMERIRRDRGRVVRRLQPLLQHIEEHLFDPGLDVNQLKRSCGVRDNSVPIQFHAQLGLPPHAYIEECRLRTGCRLLRDTELKIWQIADLLGYSSIQVFSRAFSRWAGMRPTGFRRKARREGIAIPSRVLTAGKDSATESVDVAKGRSLRNGSRTNGARVNGTKSKGLAAAAKANGQRNGSKGPATVQANGHVNGKDQAKGSRIEVENLRRALDGELEAAAADQLIRRLLNLYPAKDAATSTSTAPASGVMPWQQLGANGHGSNGHGLSKQRSNGHNPSGHQDVVEPTLTAIAAGAVGGLLDTEQIESVRAEEVWKRIKGESYEAQVAAVQHEYRFRTPALFHHLCDRSLVDGRDNRKNGVRVAELAMVALEAVRFYVSSEKDFAILQGKAYAWLGNARRLTLDYLGAEQAFREAERVLPTDKAVANRTWSSLLQNKAALRWNQRRPVEALPLCNEAIDLLGEDHESEKAARLIFLRGSISRKLHRSEDAVADFHHAIRLLESGDDRYLLATVYQALLSQLVREDRVDESLPFLGKARALSNETSSETFNHYLDWYEGLIELEKGTTENALGLLNAAKNGFLALDNLGAAALASLDLAIIHSDQGHHKEALAIVGQTLPLFQAQEAHAETLVLLGLLQKAAAAGAVKSTLLRKLRTEASRPS